MSGKPYTPRRVIWVYLLTTGLFTLAASLIWAINTIFLIQKGGLDLYQVMLVNTAFLIAQRRDPARVLTIGSILAAFAIAAIGLVGLAKLQPGLLPAALAVGLWIAWSVVFGLLGPVRSSFINEHIPSAQRATVLSLDSLFADAGGAVGQPALGWLATRFSIGLAWLVGSAFSRGRCAALCDRREGSACRGRRHGREWSDRCVTSYLNGNEHNKYQLLHRQLVTSIRRTSRVHRAV